MNQDSVKRIVVLNSVNYLACCLLFFALSNLLTPHSKVQSFFFQQFFMSSGFNNITTFKNIDAVGMHDR